jgi:hypothetical protein
MNLELTLSKGIGYSLESHKADGLSHSNCLILSNLSWLAELFLRIGIDRSIAAQAEKALDHELQCVVPVHQRMSRPV